MGNQFGTKSSLWNLNGQSMIGFHCASTLNSKMAVYSAVCLVDKRDFSDKCVCVTHNKENAARFLGTIDFRLGMIAQGSRTAQWVKLTPPEEGQQALWLKLIVFWETSAHITARLTSKNEENNKWLRQIQLEREKALEEKTATPRAPARVAPVKPAEKVHEGDFNQKLVPLNKITDVWHAAVPFLHSSTVSLLFLFFELRVLINFFVTCMSVRLVLGILGSSSLLF